MWEKKLGNYMSFSSPISRVLSTLHRYNLQGAPAAAHRFYNKCRQILGHLSNVAAEGFSHVSSNMVPKKLTQMYWCGHDCQLNTLP